MVLATTPVDTLHCCHSSPFLMGSMVPITVGGAVGRWELRFVDRFSCLTFVLDIGFTTQLDYTHLPHILPGSLVSSRTYTPLHTHTHHSSLAHVAYTWLLHVLVEHLHTDTHSTYHVRFHYLVRCVGLQLFYI